MGKSSSSSSNNTINSDINNNNINSDDVGRKNCYRGHWRPAEDDKLRDLVQRYGPQNWNFIADHLHGRSGKSCRLRWYNQLDPNINKKPFSEEEEERLLSVHRIYGNKWACIAKYFHGRTDNAVKNHYHVVMARRKRERRFSLTATTGTNLNYNKRIAPPSTNLNYNNKIAPIMTNTNLNYNNKIAPITTNTNLNHNNKIITDSTSRVPRGPFGLYGGATSSAIISSGGRSDYKVFEENLKNNNLGSTTSTTRLMNKFNNSLNQVPFIDFLGVGITSN